MITFKGVSSKDMGVIVREVEPSLLPPSTPRTIDIPAQHGLIDYGRDYEPREINVKVGLKGNSYEDVRKLVRNVAGWLDSDKPQKLVLNDEPDKYYLARVIDSTNLSPFLNYEETTINFIAHYPFAISNSVTKVTLSKNSTTTHRVSGTHESLPVFVIKIDGSSNEYQITIENEKHGEIEMRLYDNFKAGDTVIVDCKAGLVSVNGTNVNIMSLDSDFPVLASGSNKVSLKGSGAGEMTYHNQWL